MISIDNIKNFDLLSTITCGQIFRYVKNADGSFTIIASDRIINIKQNGDELLISSNDENNLDTYIKDYLDLDRDYECINNTILLRDDKMNNIINVSKGLHMIHSSAFETIISYIISANNSVPSIKKAVDKIAYTYGKKVSFENNDYYLFPKLSDLKNVSIEDYRKLGVGFRDKYIYNAVKIINQDPNILLDLNSASTDEAFAKLLKFSGIGNKVASCILLFAYQKFDVFPVDTWVKKQMFEMYGINNNKSIINFAKEKYGIYSGIALQYMFNAKRNTK